MNATKAEINPHRLYDARETAEYFGIHRDTLYKIPDKHLPRSRVGPRRGRTKFKGADILAYEQRTKR